MNKFLLVGFMVAVSAGSNSAMAAQGQPIAGWSCKMLNLTEQQSMNPNIHIPVRSSPGGPVVGYASETLAVRDGSGTSGFSEALFPTGRHVWIASDMLKTWHAAASPTSTCTPVLRPNGRPGFSYGG